MDVVTFYTALRPRIGVRWEIWRRNGKFAVTERQLSVCEEYSMIRCEL